MKLEKYTALGNTYLVAAPDEYRPLPADVIRRLCDQCYGIGADGLLQLYPAQAAGTAYQLKIWNPDGSEAERSGNGIRIAAFFLASQNLVAATAFSLSTPAGPVWCEVSLSDCRVAVRMGNASFDTQAIPAKSAAKELINAAIDVDGQALTVSAVSLGNPHCVVFHDAPSEHLARTLGPKLEHHPIFPNRTNVQFVKVLDRHNLRIEIWERGAGYTLSSGTSSCAAAAVALRCGLVDSPVDIHMAGGVLHIDIDEQYLVTLTGPVQKIGTILMDPLWLSSAEPFTAMS